MKTFTRFLVLATVLASGFFAGQVAPPIELVDQGRRALGELAARLCIRTRAESPRAHAPGQGGEPQALIADADARIRELSSAREHASAAERTLALEERILARWGERDGSPERARLQRQRTEQGALAEALDAEIAELVALATSLRACRDGDAHSRAPAERPAWLDRAKVLVRVAAMDAR